MGLDTVDFIMEVEQSFQVRFEDKELEKTITVGQFFDLLIEKLGDRFSEKCTSSMAFYRFRQILSDLYGIPRKKIRPSTKFEDIITDKDLRTEWKKIQKAFELEIPQLVRARWLDNTIALLAAVTILGGFCSPLFGIHWIWAVIAALCGAGFTWLIVCITEPLAKYLPKDCKDVADLIRGALRLNHSKMSEQVQNWNKVDVWNSMIEILVNDYGVLREKINKEAKFVADLGMDQ